PEFAGPAGPHLLLGAHDGKGLSLDVAGNDAAGADVGAIADLDGRHQGGVGTDKRAVADIGKVLVEAIVIAKNRARTDVGTRTDAPIADVAQMIGLGARFQAGVLHLDEIADVHVGADVGTRTQPRKWSNPRPRADAGADEVTVGQNLRAVLDD